MNRRFPKITVIRSEFSGKDRRTAADGYRRWADLIG